MRSFIKSAIIASATLLAQPAFANTITVGGGAGTVSCTPDCEAFTGGNPDTDGDPTTAGVLSNSTADLYDGVPSNEADEAEKLSILIGSPGLFTGADGVKSATNPSPSFSTLAEYVVFKLGNMRIYVKNTSGGELMITYAEGSGEGLGLSHYTEFGEIPIPGAIWLMGAGLAGLGFASRRKKKA